MGVLCFDSVSEGVRMYHPCLQWSTSFLGKIKMHSFLYSRECWVSSFIPEIVHGFLSITQIFSLLVPVSIKLLLSCYYFFKITKCTFFLLFLFQRDLELFFTPEIIKGFHVSRSFKNVSFVQDILESFPWNNKTRCWYIWDSQSGAVEDSSLLGFGPVSFLEWFPTYRRGFLPAYLRVESSISATFLSYSRACWNIFSILHIIKGLS